MVRQSLSLTVLCFFIVQPIQAGDFHIKGSVSFPKSSSMLEDIGKFGLCVGAAGLATYGLVKLGKWIFSQTHEQCLENAQKSYQQARITYGSVIDILADQYQGCNDIYQSLFDLSESTLYQIALAMCPAVPTSYSMTSMRYIKNLQRAIDQLGYYQESLSNRIQELNSQHFYDPESRRLKPLMESAIIQIGDLLNDLRFTHDYLDHHKSYFKLFEYEFILMSSYEREFRALDTYHADYLSLYVLMHQSVMLYQREHGSMYPYRIYLQRLEDDMNELLAVMRNLSYNYVYRLQAAEILRTKLEAIHQIVVGSPAYNEEMHQYEYARLAEESMAVQKDKTRALEKQARALEKEANELRRQRECCEECWCQEDGDCC